MGTDIRSHYLNWLTWLVAHLVDRSLLLHYKIYSKIPMMKTFTIVLSMLLFLGINIKANALPTFTDSLVPPSATNSTSNCDLQYVKSKFICKKICQLFPLCKAFSFCGQLDESNNFHFHCSLKKAGYKSVPSMGCVSGGAHEEEEIESFTEYKGG